MRDADSLIKARYASTILRIAQGADRETAARLVWGIARDLPHPVRASRDCPSPPRRPVLTRGQSEKNAPARRCANLSPSLWIVQLVHLSPRQRRGFLDGLLSGEGVG